MCGMCGMSLSSPCRHQTCFVSVWMEVGSVEREEEGGREGRRERGRRRDRGREGEKEGEWRVGKEGRGGEMEGGRRESKWENRGRDMEG